MCGISAIFNLKEQTPELRLKALRISKKIRHRGPDWSGIYCGGSAILAHERLNGIFAFALYDSERFPINTPLNKEEYYRSIFEEHFPSKMQSLACRMKPLWLAPRLLPWNGTKHSRI